MASAMATGVWARRPVTSPTAQMPGTFVREKSSTHTAPALFTATPASCMRRHGSAGSTGCRMSRCCLQSRSQSQHLRTVLEWPCVGRAPNSKTTTGHQTLFWHIQEQRRR